jgi:hypothetical protein
VRSKQKPQMLKKEINLVFITVLTISSNKKRIPLPVICKIPQLSFSLKQRFPGRLQASVQALPSPHIFLNILPVNLFM